MRQAYIVTQRSALTAGSHMHAVEVHLYLISQPPTRQQPVKLYPHRLHERQSADLGWVHSSRHETMFAQPVLKLWQPGM